MSRTDDDDIRADFIAEAGELIERLGGELVELESRPQDTELLNAIFRAFHTVKGGAGFLNLTPLVELCHVAEDIFNVLRSGRRSLDPVLLDAVMQALDQVNEMMARVAAGEMPDPAPPALIETLKQQAKGPVAAPVVAAPASPAASADTISEDEFEALLDQLQGKASAPPPAAPVAESEPLPVSGPVPVAAPDAARAAPVAGSTAREAETSVRVDTHKLDALMNLVGELVLARNRLKSLRSAAGGEPVSRAISELDFITRGLQNAVMQIRMQPIKKVFSRFP